MWYGWVSLHVSVYFLQKNLHLLQVCHIFRIKISYTDYADLPYGCLISQNIFFIPFVISFKFREQKYTFKLNRGISMQFFLNYLKKY